MLNKVKENKLLLCFVFPITIIFIYQIILYILGMFQFTSNDCYYQYISFYELLYNNIKEGTDFIFSDKGALGVDFYGIYCYYLSSPLNFLILLFPKGSMIYAVNFLIILKLGLCGLSFGYFLFKKYKTNKYIELYSLIWVFCGYFAGYLWNVMWLDVLICVPLVFLGLEELVENNKMSKYTLILTIAMISNYFMGFILCIFLCFKFFTMKFRGIKHFIISGIKFALGSITSALMSSIILIPAFFTLQSTAIASEKISDLKFESFSKFSEIFKAFMFGETANAINNSDYKANIYVSLFIVFTFFIYIFPKNVKLTEKLKKIFLLILLFISFNNNILNFIWHGFHKQNGIPNRFAFFVTLILLECSYEIILKIKDTEIYEKVIGFISSFVFFYLVYLENKEDLKTSLILSLILVTVYFIALLWDKVIYILIIVECVGFFVSSTLQVSIDGVASYNYHYEAFEEINEKYDNGFYREKMSAVNNLEEANLYNMKNSILKFNKENFNKDGLKEVLQLRKDWLSVGYNTTSNECTYYGLDNASLFNTFTHYGLQRFMFKTGNIGSDNTIRLSRDNVFLDMILGIKYDYIGADIEEKYNDNFSYQYLETIKNIKVYENKYALPLGYLIDDFVYYDEIKDVNQFDSLNILSEKMCGLKIFEKEEFSVTDFVDCEMTREIGSYLAFTRTGKNAVIGHEYIVDRDRNDYMYLHFNNLKKVRIFVNNCLILENKISQNMIEIGNLKEGDIVRIEVYSNNASVDYRYNLFLYSLNQEKFIEAYDKLSAHGLDIKEYKDGYLKGTIESFGNKKLLITIPYTENWNVYINGKKIIPELFCNTFIYLNLEEGINEIELQYVNDSFRISILVTILGVLLFSLILTEELLKKNKKRQ